MKSLNINDRYAYYLMKTLRHSFDLFTNYGENKMNEKKWLFRFIFLETVAGVFIIYKGARNGCCNDFTSQIIKIF